MISNTETPKQRMLWEQSHHKTIKKVLKRLGFTDVRKASPDDDMNHATDFTAELNGKRCHIASRLRRDGNGKWRDLTIRRDTDYGKNMSELEKIAEGEVDFYFYGWTDEDRMVDWVLIDMQAMRDRHMLYLPDNVNRNVGRDQKSFAIWNVDKLWKAGVVVARYSVGRYQGKPEYSAPTEDDARTAATFLRGEQPEKYEKLCRFFPELPRDTLYIYSFIKAGTYYGT